MSCPNCKNEEFDNKHCRYCGCYATINPTNGRTMYMVRGQIISAPEDMREQWAKHDAKYGIKGRDPIDSNGNPVEE